MSFRTFFHDNDELSANSGSASTTISATAQPGDVAVAVAHINSGTAVITPPAGFTQLGPEENVANNLVMRVYTKTLTAGDINTPLAWSSSAGARFLVQGVVFSGRSEAGIVVQILSDAVADGTIIFPQVTTTGAGWDVLEVAAARTATTTPPDWPTPAGWTLAGRTNTAFSVSPNYAIESQYRNGVAQGTYGGESATVAGAQNVTDITYAIGLPPSAGVTDTLAVSATASMSISGTATKSSGVVQLNAAASATFGGVPQRIGVVSAAAVAAAVFAGERSQGATLGLAAGTSLTVSTQTVQTTEWVAQAIGSLVVSGLSSLTSVWTTRAIPGLTLSGLKSVAGGILAVRGTPTLKIIPLVSSSWMARATPAIVILGQHTVLSGILAMRVTPQFFMLIAQVIADYRPPEPGIATILDNGRRRAVLNSHGRHLAVIEKQDVLAVLIPAGVTAIILKSEG